VAKISKKAANMTASVSPDLSMSQVQGSRISFSGRGRDFLKMLISGSLFQIPTFGFYRFWLVTKLRRHLWANTQIDGEAFEYTGTAKELLIGFLIALAVLAPLYIGYFILTVMLEEQAAFASLPLFLIMYVLIHFGSYRARKYRASRTVFRGVRFWMKGAGWAYALRAILWDIATLLTLGLALPWATASLERYRMRHTYFGNVQGDFAGTGWSLFTRGWWVWALGIAAVVGGIALGISLEDTVSDKDAIGGFVSLGIMLAAFALWPLAMAIFTRWQIDGIRFGGVVASSNLGKGVFYGLFFKLLFSSIGFLIVFGAIMALAAVLFGAFFTEAFQALQMQNVTGSSVGAMILIAFAYLALLLGMGVIQRYFFGRGLWAAVVTSITVTNLRSLDAAIAAGQASGVLGEGLADALDFNVGV
jgi:uncharacterized membrane protein YjgN (DUF898 family)